ncbi:hypothetical protein ACS386_13750 [Flavobacteriaceae bacterium LMO-SS05]
MNKIYLDEDLKKYYANCLKTEIVLNNINQDLQDPLISINKSENIRTLFSKKDKHDLKNCLHSYLRIAFTSKVEQTLLTQIIPTFELNFNLNEKFEYKCSTIDPYIQPERKITKENKGSEWLINPEYFNVNQIKFDLQNGDSAIHDMFWAELNKYLSEL